MTSSKKQKRSGNEWHRRKASFSTRKFPGRKSVRAGHTAPQSAGFCCVCGAPIHRGDTNKTADDVSSLKSAGNRALTGLQSLPAIPATRAAMESSRHFAYESAIYILASESNICYSPVSLEMALLIAMQGAGGNTLAQLQRVLACTALSEQDLASIYRSIVGKRKGKSQFDAANSLWIPQDLHVNSEYIDATKRLYDTQVKEFDGETNTAINNWIKKRREACSIRNSSFLPTPNW